MNRIFQSLKMAALVIVAGMTFSSCSKSPEHVNYIPKDANFVMAFDVKSMAVKSLDFKEIFKIENIKKTISGSDSTSEKIKNSGIDLLSKMYCFGQITGESKGYGAAVVPLSDEAKFEAFLKDISSEFTINQEGDFKIGTSKDQPEMVVVWNKSTAIVYGSDGSDKSNPKDKVMAFFNLKKEESLGENDKNFQELQKETADISLWISFEKIAQLAAQINPMAGAMNMKDTYFTAACNFEKGQIVVNSKYHANKELAEKLSIGKEKINKDLIAVAPGKSLVSLLSLSMDVNKLYALLEKENMTGTAEEAAKMAGISGKDLIAIFTGDVIATLNGASLQEVPSMDWSTGETVMRKEPRPEYAVVLGISDQTKGTQLLDAFTAKGVLAKEDGIYSVMEGEAFIVNKGSYWVVAPKSMKDLAKDGSGEKLNGEISNLLAENSGVFYFNLTQVPDFALDLMGSKVKEYFKTTPLESVTVTGSSLKDNTSTGKFVIAFKDKEQNSLITLAKMSSDLALSGTMQPPVVMEREQPMIEVDTVAYVDEPIEEAVEVEVVE